MKRVDVGMFGAPAFSLSMDADGEMRFVGMNDVLCKQAGLVAAEVVGSTPRECFPPTIAAHVETQYRHCVRQRSTYEYEEHLDLPGEAKWWRTTLSPLIDPLTDEVVGVFGLTFDITDRKRDELELRSAVFKDPLTGICNRRKFDRDLDAAMSAARDTGRSFTLVMADVDRFKQINDTHGHAVGDAVLREIADRLAGGMGRTDRLARIGGDEFAMILDVDGEAAGGAALLGFQERLRGPVRAGGRVFDVGLSFGAAHWRQGMTTAAILSAADAAMYRTKRGAAA